MIKKYALLFLGLILAFFLPGQSTQKGVMNKLKSSNDQITQKQLDLIFESTKDFPENTELAIAIIHKGKSPIFYGLKRSDDILQTIDNRQSVFEIASISKVFTTSLLANFIVENKLSLDDAIQDYYKSEMKTAKKISFKQLANHTSGLHRLPVNLNLYSSDPNNPYKNYGKEKIEEFLKKYIAPQQAPGIKYEYSNLGAGILGYLLAEQDNTNYEKLLQKYIFSKYNMTRSTTDRALIKEHLVPALNYKGDETSNWDFNILAGAGGILSSVEDLSKFAVAQLKQEDAALVLTQKSTFSISDNMDIGLGWHIIKDQSGNKFHWHNGGSGGYTSSMVLNLDKKNAVIILSNVSAYNEKMGSIDDLSFELIGSLE